MRIASVSHAYLPWFFGFFRRFSTISADEIIFFTDASADIRTCPSDHSIKSEMHENRIMEKTIRTLIHKYTNLV